MRLLDWFKDWATRSNRSIPTPRHPDLHPINIPKLSQELRLRDQAQRLGAGGIPAPDAVSLTAPESAVVQIIETYRQGYLDWAVARMKLLTMDLGKLNITAAVNHALHADKQFERKAASLLSERDADLRALSESARSAQAELDSFRTAHGLQREAYWPMGFTAFMWYSLVLALVIVEAGFNASFFAHGLDTGWLGGMSYAAVLALVNVGIAFMWGKWGVRYVHHRHPLGKTAGVLAILAAVGLIVLIGFGIAHFRGAMTAEAIDPARAAYESLKNRTSGLDILSWGLFFLSVGFGLVALLDGYKTDDPYPGYGKISRRTQLVLGDYEEELEDLREQLEELKNKELDGLTKALDLTQAGLAVYRARIDEKDAAALRLATALQNADNSVTALLSEFRNENELHRNSLPRPKYFDQKPALKELPFPDFSTEADRKSWAVQDELVQRLLSDVEAIRARIQEAFNNKYDLLKPLGTQYRPTETT